MMLLVTKLGIPWGHQFYIDIYMYRENIAKCLFEAITTTTAAAAAADDDDDVFKVIIISIITIIIMIIQFSL